MPADDRFTEDFREAGVVLLAGRDGAVAQDLPVALVVRAEQVVREVVAAAMPLAAAGIDVHLHRVAPVCAAPPRAVPPRAGPARAVPPAWRRAVSPAGARADIRRASSAPHS